MSCRPRDLDEERKRKKQKKASVHLAMAEFQIWGKPASNEEAAAAAVALASTVTHALFGFEVRPRPSTPPLHADNDDTVLNMGTCSAACCSIMLPLLQ